jgi:hypothetical protein
MVANNSTDFTAAERIESLKAGILGGLSFTLAYSIAVVGNNLVLVPQFEVLASLQLPVPIILLMRLGIAFFSGFLFGITYRYVIREDVNSHLNEGAVLAFGLVRGLASVEVKQNFLDTFWLLAVLSIESLFCFTIARFTLDFALHRHWVKFFKSN